MRRITCVAVTLCLLVTGATLMSPVQAVVARNAAGGAADQHARYCPGRDAYEVTDCASRPGLPSTPIRTQLRWLRRQLAGSAADITAREVRAHVAPEVLAMPGSSAPELVAAFVMTLDRFGPLRFVGFSYPPRSHQGMALFRADSGDRLEVPVSITVSARKISSLAVTRANPVLVPRGPYSGWFDIGGRRMFLRCTGQGEPTVLFENGLTTDWYVLQHRVAATTRVCSYDPARQNGPASRSDSAPAPRTANDRVRDLRRLLETARVPGPFVIVGHSNGGLFSLMYASRHPRAVRGLVLIDGVHPQYHRRTFDALKQLIAETEPDVTFARFCAVPPRQVDWERMDMCRSERQARRQLRDHPLRQMSLTVISHGRPDGPPSPERDIVEAVWDRLQADLAALLPRSRHLTARRSGHDIQHTQPRLVLREIRGVVAAVRESRQVSQ